MKAILKPISPSTHVQFKNILFTTDFSDAAKTAVPYAAALARRYGAKLYTLHVRPPIASTETPPENWRALEKAAEVEAQREKFALAHTFEGLHPEIMIHEGDLWPNIKGGSPGLLFAMHRSCLADLFSVSSAGWKNRVLKIEAVVG
ncbi:MAG: universal stress protein [Candidatus Acidiferrales bacterium]